MIRFYGDLATRTAFILAISISLASCVRSIPDPTPVIDYRSRIHLPGFSILAPKGPEWAIRHFKHAIFFSKMGSSKSHTILASAVSWPVLRDFENMDEFLEWSREMHEKMDAPNKYSILEHLENIDQSLGPYCVRYSMKRENQGPPGRENEVILDEIIGFSCMHPDAPSVFVDIRYMESDESSAKQPKDFEIGEQFVRSLIFEKL